LSHDEIPSTGLDFRIDPDTTTKYIEASAVLQGTVVAQIKRRYCTMDPFDVI
jgi:hypothetical protein